MTFDKETLTTYGAAAAMLATSAGMEVTETEVDAISNGVLAVLGAITALVATVRAAFKTPTPPAE